MKPETDTRARILNAAMDAFVSGEGSIEMNDVAKRADVSAGLAYHYFGSKAGLLSAVVSDFYDRYDAVANQRFDDTPLWTEREFRRLNAAIAFLYHDPVAPIMLGKLSGSAEVVAAEAARRESMIEMAAFNLSRAQESGDIPADINPGIAAATIVGGVRQATSKALASPEPPNPDKLALHLWSFISGALRLPPLKTE